MNIIGLNFQVNILTNTIENLEVPNKIIKNVITGDTNVKVSLELLEKVEELTVRFLLVEKNKVIVLIIRKGLVIGNVFIKVKLKL